MSFVHINYYIRLNEAIRSQLIESLTDSISYNVYSAPEYSVLYKIKVAIENYPRLQPPADVLAHYAIDEEWGADFNNITAAVNNEFPSENERKNEYLNDLKRVVLNIISSSDGISKNTANMFSNILKKFRLPEEVKEQSWSSV
jgi:hypothetical protein